MRPTSVIPQIANDVRPAMAVGAGASQKTVRTYAETIVPQATTVCSNRRTVTKQEVTIATTMVVTKCVIARGKAVIPTSATTPHPTAIAAIIVTVWTGPRTTAGIESATRTSTIASPATTRT